MIGRTMADSSKIIGSLLVVGIVLLYMNSSTRRRSEGLPPLPSDLLEKITKAEAVEKALIEKVKASILPPALEIEPIKLSKPNRTHFSQNHQDELVVKMTRKKVNGIFFEAGALDGELFSNTLHLERALGWTGLLVEPSKKSFDKLKQKGRRAQLLHACLSPNLEAAEMIFDATGDLPLAKLASDQSKQKNMTEMVSCYPLYTILMSMDVPIIDYMSLDIEGNELKVLNTVPWGRLKVRILGVEITHIIPEGPEGVRVFLEQKGFVFYKRQGEDYYFYHPDFAGELDLS